MHPNFRSPPPFLRCCRAQLEGSTSKKKAEWNTSSFLRAPARRLICLSNALRLLRLKDDTGVVRVSRSLFTDAHCTSRWNSHTHTRLLHVICIITHAAIVLYDSFYFVSWNVKGTAFPEATDNLSYLVWFKSFFFIQGCSTFMSKKHITLPATAKISVITFTLMLRWMGYVTAVQIFSWWPHARWECHCFPDLHLVTNQTIWHILTSTVSLA